MRWHRHGASIYGTQRWKAVRQQVRRRDGWACVTCGAQGRVEVDHIVPLRAGGAVFDLANLQCLCPSCHTRKTRLEIGHPDLTPARRAWRDLLRDMTRNRAQGIKNA